MRDSYLKITSQNSRKKSSKIEDNKNLKINLIHEEFYQGKLDFSEYFDKLTHQIMSPYESNLDDEVETEDDSILKSKYT